MHSQGLNARAGICFSTVLFTDPVFGNPKS